MSFLVAIDQSTSATKALLFSLDGEILDSESLPHKQHYPRPGWVEHDANEIWQNVQSVAKQLLDRHPEAAPQVRGVCLTNQRETVLVFDRQTGKPLHRAIVWQCRRSDGVCQDFAAAGHSSTIEERTGLKLDAYFSASKLTWLQREHPEIREQLLRGEALVGTIDAYLVYRLTSGAVFATDHTNASRTLLFNLAERSWDNTLCDLFGVPATALPEIRESFASFGETDLAGALPNTVPICGIMGDSQASLFAQRCYSPGQTKATFGTGTSVMMNIGDQLTHPQGGMVAALAWVLNGVPTYALEGLINYSAATIAWLKDQLHLIESSAESESLAAAVDDTGGVYLVPAFAGMGAPYWQPEARAAIVGMTAYTQKEHIVRAALESIAYQINDVLEVMDESALPPTVVHADGGPTRNALLMQLVANITQLPVTASELPESSARGAAMAGLVGLGVVESLSDLAALPCPTRTYQPNINASAASELTSGWKSAVQRVL